VNGFVDDQLRALIRVPVSASPEGERKELLAWIDTAFNGGLAIPHRQVAELGLSKQSSAEAILADGRSVELEMFACFFDWFGNTYETQIAASDGEYPLLGTMLLAGRRLDINYATRMVELIEWTGC
jgi:clan AA aspartic protease